MNRDSNAEERPCRNSPPKGEHHDFENHKDLDKKAERRRQQEQPLNNSARRFPTNKGSSEATNIDWNTGDHNNEDLAITPREIDEFMKTIQDPLAHSTTNWPDRTEKHSVGRAGTVNIVNYMNLPPHLLDSVYIATEIMLSKRIPWTLTAGPLPSFTQINMQ